MKKSVFLKVSAFLMCTTMLVLSGCNGKNASSSSNAKTSNSPKVTNNAATTSPKASGSSAAASASATSASTQAAQSTSSSATAASVSLPTIKPGTGAYSGGIADANTPIQAALCSEGFADQAPEACVDTMAVQFFATTTFNSVEVVCPTWTQQTGHSITLKLFAWAGSYDATLLGNPIKESTFSDYKDGSNVKLEFSNQVDGEYLLELSNPDAKPGVGVWYKPNKFEGQRSYKSNEIWEDVAIRFYINYTQTPVKLYGPLSDPKIN